MIVTVEQDNDPKALRPMYRASAVVDFGGTLGNQTVAGEWRSAEEAAIDQLIRAIAYDVVRPLVVVARK